jgi:hypothetical protein
MGKLLKLTRQGHLESLDLKERLWVPLCAASHPCAKQVHMRHLVRWHTDRSRNFFYIELSVFESSKPMQGHWFVAGWSDPPWTTQRLAVHLYFSTLELAT